MNSAVSTQMSDPSLHALRESLALVVADAAAESAAAESSGPESSGPAPFGDSARLLLEATSASTQPTVLPVVRDHLPAAIASGRRGRWAGLCDAFAAASESLHWRISYPHLPGTPEVKAFRDHYAFAPLVLPPPADGAAVSPFESEDLVCGFTIQAPAVDYPGHHHEAAELYGVLGGSTLWRIGQGAEETKQAGSVIAHRPHEEHAMRTTGEAVLNWVIWSGNARSHVYMPVLDNPEHTMAPLRY